MELLRMVFKLTCRTLDVTLDVTRCHKMSLDDTRCRTLDVAISATFDQSENEFSLKIHLRNLVNGATIVILVGKISMVCAGR